MMSHPAWSNSLSKKTLDAAQSSHRQPNFTQNMMPTGGRHVTVRDWSITPTRHWNNLFLPVAIKLSLDALLNCQAMEWMAQKREPMDDTVQKVKYN